MSAQNLSILNVIPTLGGGGAERQVVLLAEALAKRGIDVQIAHLQGGPHFNRAQRAGVPTHRLRVVGNHDPRALTELLFLIRRLRPSVVQTWLLHADVFGGAAALISRVPWVLAERASGEAYKDGAKNSLRRWIGRHADAVVANSHAGLRYWRDVGYRGEGLVIRNIVENRASDHADALVQVDGIGAQHEVVLVVGRLTEQKNPTGVLDALELVFAARPACQAHFVGVGPMEGRLKEMVRRSSRANGKVQFHGFVHDVGPWYRRARVCLSLSRFEGTPNAVLEAMQFGCPLVVSEIPEHLELLDSSSAWLVPLGDAAAAARSVCEALCDPLEAHRRSDRAREKLRGYEPDAIAKQYAELYSRLSRA